MVSNGDPEPNTPRVDSESIDVVQGFYLTHPPPVIPDYQTPRSREISDYLEPVNSGPYEEIGEHFTHSTQEGSVQATYENSPTEPGHDDYEPMPDIQHVHGNARYENITDRNVEYENAGFNPNTTPGIYELTPGGYEELKRIENKAKESFLDNEDSLNEGNSTIYDTGYEPASSHSTAPGTSVLSKRQYEELKRVEYENTKKSK